MAGNPLIDQGVLNRLRASVLIPNFPALNVTPPFLGKEGIRISLEGETTEFIDTMTGAVISGMPYQRVSVVIPLLKTQGLAAQFKAQIELNAALGNITVISDAVTFPDYNFINSAIQSIRELNYSGDDPHYGVTIRGYYNINSDLFNIG